MRNTLFTFDLSCQIFTYESKYIQCTLLILVNIILILFYYNLISFNMIPLYNISTYLECFSEDKVPKYYQITQF